MGNRVLAILVIICGYSYKTAFFLMRADKNCPCRLMIFFTGIIKKRFAKY